MSPTIAEVHATLTAPGQPFEMDEVVIRGVPTRTWKHAPPSLRDVLLASRAQGDAVFLVYEDETLTFEEHFRAAAHLATCCATASACSPATGWPSPCATSPSGPWPSGRRASAGAVVVPLNGWWTGPELDYGLDDSGSSWLRRRGAGRAPG